MGYRTKNIFDQLKEPAADRICLGYENFWLKLQPKLAPPKFQTKNHGYIPDRVTFCSP